MEAIVNVVTVSARCDSKHGCLLGRRGKRPEQTKVGASQLAKIKTLYNNGTT